MLLCSTADGDSTAFTTKVLLLLRTGFNAYQWRSSRLGGNSEEKRVKGCRIFVATLSIVAE